MFLSDCMLLIQLDTHCANSVLNHILCIYILKRYNVQTWWHRHSQEQQQQLRVSLTLGWLDSVNPKMAKTLTAGTTYIIFIDQTVIYCCYQNSLSILRGFFLQYSAYIWLWKKKYIYNCQYRAIHIFFIQSICINESYIHFHSVIALC